MDSSRWSKVKEAFNAAYELPEEERADFLNQCDNDLRWEVERLLRAGDEAEGFISEPAVVDLGLANAENVDHYLGKQIDSYFIEREIGHGGMGTVYLASRSDASFEKQFAIKLIKRGMDTNAVLKRFMMERQILTQLQHPNIANLVDGGTTTDGLPYFVMEYVEGVPVTKFCDEHELGKDERLALFRSICTVISYAHQNLVVHRDLKPSNIIVTEDGTPKLLDFGIAKLLHPDWSLDTNEATATMFRVMTPEYASPEQLLGQPITTASDVYSLGVVLYELLCGRRPIKVERRLPDEAANIVLTEEPVKPSSVVGGQSAEVRNTNSDLGRETVAKLTVPNPKSLLGDVDNIVLKALAKEPERRYQSVHEFSEDIRRHLEGLPVTATADSLSYRFAKFTKRHRMGVVAGGVIILTLLAATAVTSWQALVARRERDKAEQRFSQVRKLAHTVLFDYHDGIAELAGSTPIREKMVKDAIEYLDNLASESAGDADLQRELATAYEKVGDVQGNPYLANLGNPEGALESYRKGLAILEALPSIEGDRPESRLPLAAAREKIGDILWARGASADSQTNYRQALAICEDLKAHGTLSDASAPFRLYNRIGQTQEQLVDYESALQSYQLSLKEAQELSTVEPGNARYRRSVAVGYAKVGDIYYETHDFKTAGINFQTSFSILKVLSDNEPNNMQLRRSLGLIDARVALTEMKAGNLVEAINTNRQTIEIQRQISVADPNNLQIRYDLAATLGNLGECYGMVRSFDLAEQTFQEAIAISKQALAKDPTYAQARMNFAVNYVMYAQMLQKSGDPSRALANYQNAREIYEEEPLRSESAEQLAELYEGIGDSLLMLDRSVKNIGVAKTMYQQTLETLGKLQESGKLNQENINKPGEISRKITRCDTIMESISSSR